MTSPGRSPLTILALWLGQLVSLVGSALTGFAIGLEVYRASGSITELSLVSFFSTFPLVALSPIAGVLVDRWNHRRAMLFADCGAASGALLVWALLVSHRYGVIEVHAWHFYAPIAISSAFDAFRWPAYQAATTLLVPARHRGRANGLVDLSQGVAQIGGPTCSAWLLARVGVDGVVAIDLATFAIAIASLAAVRLPDATPAGGERRGVGTLWQECAFGWRYLRARRGLAALTGLLAAQNVVVGMVMVLVTPMVLHIADATALGRVLSTAGLGMLAGALTMSVWGGPRRRMRAVVAFTFVSGIALFMGVLPATVPRIATSAALFLFCTPLVTGCTLAIWQSVVPIEVQGRVFALRRMIGLSALPMGNLLAGPLAEHVFGAGLGGAPGYGLGLFLALLGCVRVATAVAAHLHPALQRVEDDTERDDAVAAAPAPLPPAGT